MLIRELHKKDNLTDLNAETQDITESTTYKSGWTSILMLAVSSKLIPSHGWYFNSKSSTYFTRYHDSH